MRQYKNVARRFSFIHHTWFHVLVGGLLLFAVIDAALLVTSNPGLIAPVTIVGAFLVPVTFVVYMYGRLHVRDIPVPLLTVTFMFGGGLGVAIAGLIEYETLRSLKVLPLLGVGVIEESAKLVFPIFIYRGGRYRSEADGLLFGVASGMGFAALETVGYGISALVKSHGDVGALDETLLLRGLLSPSGHAAWTGFVCAVLWTQRRRTMHQVLNWAVIGSFILAVLLHSSWDFLSSITERTTVGSVFDILGLFVIVLLSLGLLFWRVPKAARALREEIG